MSEDLYAPPVARVVDQQEGAAREFYVVAPRKFLFLYMLTFGYYSIYWFYQNWTLYKRRHAASLWPVPRSIFQIFFVHQLFDNIDAACRRAGQRYVWNAGTQATAYVILVIVTRLADRFIDRVVDTVPVPLMALALVATFLPILPLLAAQRALNLAEGDPEGRSNAAFSAANFAWMIAGGLFWIVVLLGLTMLVLNPDVAA
ncbi:MAG: hypothetical protein AMXMBFR59_10750 [Rhodanobacteraceae bacterium]